MSIKLANMLDPIQTTLCPDVWDASNNLLPGIKDYIYNRALALLGKDFSELVMIGTLVGYQYTMKSDIDVNVRIPDWKLTDEINHKRKDTNGQLLPGTEHPVNLFLQAIPEDKTTSWQDAPLGAYDVLNDTWLVTPKVVFNVPPSEYFRLDLTSADMALDEFVKLTNEYHKKVKLKNEYEKFLQDKRTSPMWDFNQDAYLLRLSRLEAQEKDALQTVYNYVKYIDQARKMQYSLQWGVPRNAWRNVLFKKLEGSAYSKFFEYVANLPLGPHRSLSEKHPVTYENTTY